MGEDLRAAVVELADIARQCPDNMQEKCFELLLADHLAARRGGAAQAAGEPVLETPDIEQADADSTAEDITQSDIHVRAKKFLEKYGVGIGDINQIFYKEGTELLPLVDDLQTTKLAESQVRIALLQSLKSGLLTGEFAFDGEAVRTECQERKCYDRANFAKNFKNNASLFEGFESYDKSEPTVKLSEAGRKQLAALIKELA